MRIETDKIYCGDSLQVLQTLPDNCMDCCVTSPPYYALRDYGTDGQIGREATPEEYVSRITAVFHEVKRVLTPEGTCWLNIADTYCGTGSKADHQDPKYPKGRNGQQVAVNHRAPGCKPKDLIGIPWLVALALRGDGWYLRSSIIWHKGNPMPESTRDRPTRCYEYVFLLTKSKKYFYDWQAVAEPIALTTAGRLKSGVSKGNKYNVTVPGQNQPQKINRPREKGAYADELICPVRSRRNVWQINTASYRGGHFAAFPPKLAETCILAGCPVGGIVLDPFLGSGTTAAAAKSLDRRYIGIEINVDLENFNLSHVPVYIMGEEQLSMYAMYMSSLGNRPDLFPQSGYISKYYENPPADYEIPPAYLEDEQFARLIEEAEKYVGFPYVWGGSSPETSFDCSGFVSYVLTNSGLYNTGRLGAQGLYNISTRVSNPQPGDLVFFTGTYDTPGVSHVGIYVGEDGDGSPVMLHCGDPIQYAKLDTSYWQSHFYAYGRLHYN